MTRNIPTEFTDRICNILLVFIKGTKKQLTCNDPLVSKLEQLESVVRKAARIKPISDLGKSIEDFFRGVTLRNEFEESEKDEAKVIVLNMVTALKYVVGNLGDYDQHFNEYIHKINLSQDLKDVLKVKEDLINNLQEFKTATQDLKTELESRQETIKNLVKKLEETKSQTMIDPLTKTLNRAAYNLKVAQTIREFKKLKNSNILIVCDIDHFKKFNDTYGHKLGDKVLTAVASSIQGCIRKSDDVFRYGGEEFVLLLKGCPSDVGKKIASKIRTNIERDYLVHKDKKINVTVSLGMTVLHKQDSEESFFERADQALYLAKRNGRNRLEINQLK